MQFGFYETDTHAGFMTLDAAERVLGRDRARPTSSCKLDGSRTAPRASAQRPASSSSARTIRSDDWTELNGALYSALWLEKLAISLTIGLIVMVAALNIVASLVLLVMEKSRDIAILRTMGAPARAIRRIFILQGLTIGTDRHDRRHRARADRVLSVADRYQLIKLPSDVYQITYLPFRVEAARRGDRRRVACWSSAWPPRSIRPGRPGGSIRRKR